MPAKRSAIPSSSRVKALKALFDKFDSDGSGELDKDETKQMLWEMGLDPSEEDVDRVMSRADKDGNSNIGFQEFAAGCLDATDSNVYTGIRRRKDSGIGGWLDRNSMFLDLRKKRAASKSVWTKDDIERSLMEASITDPCTPGSADDPHRRALVGKKMELDKARKEQRDLENKLLQVRDRIKGLEGEVNDLERAQQAKDDVPILLSGVLKNCQTANDIAVLLKKDAKFSARIFKETGTGENTIEVNLKTAYGSFFWSMDKFNERFAEMLNMQDDYNHCKQNGIDYIDDRPQEMDPFFDSEYQLIGVATAWLKSLGNMMESSVTSAVLSSAGSREGEMVISICPCDKNGGEGPWDDDDDLDPFVDGPDELVGQEILFRVRIPSVKVHSPDGTNPYDNVYVRYKIQQDNENEIWSRSDKHNSPGAQVQLDFCEEHAIVVDASFVKHLSEGRILFELWGQVAAARTQLAKKADALTALSRMKLGGQKSSSAAAAEPNGTATPAASPTAVSSSPEKPIEPNGIADAPPAPPTGDAAPGLGGHPGLDAAPRPVSQGKAKDAAPGEMPESDDD
eukprot:NODE_376_length_2023_cov_62.188291_g369_i0.p1 GENE.NODE_376_length_2023_cov_62.188291_g369_i0~~NODE_376_length_2023_cov_62.188291_g369_i0.p1  ORF type:complete len:567 (-),score=123.56 NODE_376_length_2023_cov_62.188291_g369_i0:248-1948(-)